MITKVQEQSANPHTLQRNSTNGVPIIYQVFSDPGNALIQRKTCLLVAVLRFSRLEAQSDVFGKTNAQHPNVIHHTAKHPESNENEKKKKKVCGYTASTEDSISLTPKRCPEFRRVLDRI